MMNRDCLLISQPVLMLSTKASRPRLLSSSQRAEALLRQPNASGRFSCPFSLATPIKA